MVRRKRTCTGPRCSRQAVARGLCNAHYQQRWAGKSLTPVGRYVPISDVPRPAEPCSFEGCDTPREARGMCMSHYFQQRRGRELTPVDHSQFKGNQYVKVEK